MFDILENDALETRIFRLMHILERKNLKALSRAKYYFIEALRDGIPTSVNDATDYAIGIGQADQPDIRRAWSFHTISVSGRYLMQLNKVFPVPALWLVTDKGRAKFKGTGVWEGIVHAMAEIYHEDEDSDWVHISNILNLADGDKEPLKCLLEEWICNKPPSSLQEVLIPLWKTAACMAPIPPHSTG